jgi:hypothetical protein
LAGTLATTNGGTGLTSFTSGGVVYASSTSALATGSALTFDSTNSRLVVGASGGVSTAYLQATGNGSGTADTRLLLTSTGNGGTGRGTTILFQSAGSSNSVDVVKLLGLQETASATANNASFAIQVANSSGTLTEVGRFNNAGSFAVNTTTFNGSSASAAISLGGTSSASYEFIIGGTFQSAITSTSGLLTNLIPFGGAWRVSVNGGSERMRIDTSGNVGIGTSSPPLKLSLLSNVSTNNVSTPVVMLGSDRVDYYASINSVRGSASTYLGLAFSTSFNAAPAEVMRLDPAGNLGLGVTPSAWGSIIKPIEFANSAYIGGQTNSTAALYAGANAYYNGTSWIYKTSTLATNYISSNGAHSWFNAASGTAGNAITFTQAMTLDASGNLGVGTTSPAARLDVTTASVNSLQARFGNVAGRGLEISTASVATINDAGSVLNAKGAGGGTLIFQTDTTERARIDSNGNLLVGGTAARGTTVGSAHLDLFNGTAPAGTLTNGVSLYSSSGDLKFMNAAGDAFDVGYRNIPQNAQTGNYTLTLADSGDHIYHAVGAGAATYTIPANGSVAFPIGTAVTFINMSTTAISIAITTDTMYLSSAGTTGTRTLAQYGSATAIKLTSTTWLISGSGLT